MSKRKNYFLKSIHERLIENETEYFEDEKTFGWCAETFTVSIEFDEKNCYMKVQPNNKKKLSESEEDAFISENRVDLLAFWGCFRGSKNNRVY